MDPHYRLYIRIVSLVHQHSKRIIRILYYCFNYLVWISTTACGIMYKLDIDKINYSQFERQVDLQLKFHLKYVFLF